MNPNGVGVKNGNIFGFDCTEKEAELVLVPVPWDATASYGLGTSKGPEAILEASTQLDFYHPMLEKAWEQKIFMKQISEEWFDINEVLSEEMLSYHDALENGKDTKGFSSLLDTVKRAQKTIRKGIKKQAISYFDKDKKVGIIGGEHSVPLGLFEAYSKKYKSFGILQFDAHADLRNAYESIEESHASIMFNALKNKSLKNLTQVGIRDLCQFEVDQIKNDSRIKTFFDWDLQRAEFEGRNWSETVKKIIKELPKRVHISFDIDVLSPEFCVSTGTPVPGGLTYSKAVYLIQELAKSSKEIIGFDLCEVAPGNTDYEANVGARILWELCTALKINSKKTF